MTPEELAAIEARIEDPNTNWSLLIVQRDRNALLAEVKRLRKQAQDIEPEPEPVTNNAVTGNLSR